jgi:acyl phosphate:glycerol-3-phosphate acyltransferase
MIVLALILFSFLFGSIPYGLLVARSMGVDILKVGSGNIGATNVVRALGPKVGLFVFVLDVLKGAVPAYISHFFISVQTVGLDVQTWSFIMGVTAMLGHMLSPWLKFRGGKGVATGFGATLGAIPITGLCAVTVMIIVTIATRYVSLASICAAVVVLPISIFIAKDTPQIIPLITVMAGFIIFKHRANI